VLARSPTTNAPGYYRHQPEQTELYSVIAKHYPRFVDEIERSGGYLPKFVRQEFEDYLKCGLLEHGFLRVKCDSCCHEHLVAFSCKRRGFCPSCGARRMVEHDKPVAPMSWMQRLKRVFAIDIETCPERRLSGYGGLRAPPELLPELDLI